MIPFKKIALLVFCLFSLHSGLYAVSMQQAINNAARDLAESSVKHMPSKQMVVEVVNYHSKKEDQTAKKIRTELYLALEKQLPDFRMILLEESLTGVEKGTVFVKGTYEQRGEIISVSLQALVGSDGVVLKQTEVEYSAPRKVEKRLVAVLDVEAKMLNIDQRKAFSDVFRTAINEIGIFDMASSADIDKMDPDRIQEMTGCTRDSCATVIGEQLGVDRVITSSLRKVTDDLFFLSGKIIDINNGALLVSKTVKHTGNIMTLDRAFEQLAIELCEQLDEKTEEPAPVPVAKPAPAPEPPPPPPPEPEPEPEPKPEPRWQEPEPKEPEPVKDSRIMIGVANDFNLNSLTVTDQAGNESEADVDQIEFEKTNGFQFLFVGEGERGDFRFSFEIIQVEATILDEQSDSPPVFHHTMFNIGWMTTATNNLLFGFGFGYVYSNILCDTCFYEPGNGVNFNLKLGFSGESIGLVGSFYSLSANATRSYTVNNRDYEYDYSWSATATAISLLFIF